MSLYNIYSQLTPCRVVATSNISGTYFNGILGNGNGATLTISSSSLIIDNVTLNLNDRVLLQNQTNTYQNGVYFVSSITNTSVVLQRSNDFQSVEQMNHAGIFVPVSAGSVNNGSIFVLVEPIPNIIGVNPIIFVSVSSEGTGQFLQIQNNLNDVANKTTSFNNVSPLTGKGDLIVYDGTNNVRFAAGANNSLLAYDSTQSTGLKTVASSTFLQVANNLSDVSSKTTSFNNVSPLTTKGDIIAFDGTNNVRVPAGANNSLLAYDSTQTAGLKTIASTTFLQVSNNLSDVSNKTTSFDNVSPLTTKGDVVVFNGTHNVRQAPGTDGYLLSYDSTQATGLKAVAPTSVAGFVDNAVFVGTSGQGVTSATPTAVKLDTLLESTAGNTWTTNGDTVGMKCGQAGTYMFMGICPVQSQSANLGDYGVLAMRFAKNGTVTGPMTSYNMPVPANGGAKVITEVTCMAMLTCAVNDVITFNIYSGTNANTYTVPDPSVTGGLHTAQVSVVRLT